MFTRLRQPLAHRSDWLFPRPVSASIGAVAAERCACWIVRLGGACKLGGRARRILVSVSRRATAQGALALGALGVVFGDIGTSPLYTVQTVFNPGDPHPVTVSRDSIF